MTSVLSHRSIAALKPIALVSALATLSFPVVAQVETGQQLSPVTVSQSRFESDVSTTPIGATVITAAELREAGIENVNEAIRKIGGVYGRQSFSGNSDYSLDLRGFGENSDRNIVLLVDGIRISESEMTTSLLSSIPIESVERIEIVRGGSSVLYGEGATSGTIQIITKRGKKNSTSASASAIVGSNRYQEMRASLAKGWDLFSLDLNLGSLKNDNYRANNAIRQDNFSGGLQWATDGTRLGFRIESSRQDSRFPGALTISQFLANPRQTNTPNEYGSFDSDRYTVFGEHRFGNLAFAAEFSHRIKNSEFFQSGSLTPYRSEMTQFSPRVRYTTSKANFTNEFVAGVDIGHVNRIRKAFYAEDNATQRSDAIYFRDEFRSGPGRLAFGARHERFEKNTYDQVLLSSNYSNTASVNAWSLEGAYQLQKALQVFSKVGRSYRIANVDDNAGKASNELLLPQNSDDLEIGLVFGVARNTTTVKIFRHKLKNEIFFDQILYANLNLDPTKREGFEVSTRAVISEAVSMSAIVQHVSAKFTDGPYQGIEIPLVPKNTAVIRLNWLPQTNHKADLGIQWADKQRYAGDFSNSCQSKIPAFATLDARYAIRSGDWEFALSGSNLTDKNYYTQAYSCGGLGFPNIYPEAGRVIKLSVRKDF